MLRYDCFGHVIYTTAISTLYTYILPLINKTFLQIYIDLINGPSVPHYFLRTEIRTQYGEL